LVLKRSSVPLHAHPEKSGPPNWHPQASISNIDEGVREFQRWRTGFGRLCAGYVAPPRRLKWLGPQPKRRQQHARTAHRGDRVRLYASSGAAPGRSGPCRDSRFDGDSWDHGMMEVQPAFPNTPPLHHSNTSVLQHSIPRWDRPQHRQFMVDAHSGRASKWYSGDSDRPGIPGHPHMACTGPAMLGGRRSWSLFKTAAVAGRDSRRL
jgi:hypothetical protein